MPVATRRPVAPPLTQVGHDQAGELLPKIRHATQVLAGLADDLARAVRHRLPSKDIEHLAPIAEDATTAAGVLRKHFDTLTQLVRESAPVAAGKGGAA